MLTIPLLSEHSLATLLAKLYACTESLAFSPAETGRIVTATKEIAVNVLKYAKRGEAQIQIVERPGQKGIEVRISDEGEGIADVAAALRDHYSTSGSLGIGLAGAQRLIDEMEIESKQGVGTTVRLTHWKREDD